MKSNPYALARAKKGTTLFVPFTVLGDPDPQQSIEIIQTLVDSGADALELGFPFSDPPADGPIIQQADMRALRAGVRIDDCFAILKNIRTFTDIPIGLLVYYNIVLQRGIENFYRDCRESGVTSVLIADLPLEHADRVVAIAKSENIAPVFLVSDVTTDERMKKISLIAEGYLYIVSYIGVTGVRNALREELIRSTIDRARRYSKLPCIVGFGIQTPQDVLCVLRAGADGAIVASRIVQEIPDRSSIEKICKEISSCILVEKNNHKK